MAEEKKQDEEGAAAPASSGKLKWILIAGAAVVVLGAAGAGVVLLRGGPEQPAAEAGEAEPEAAALDDHAAKAEPKAEHAEKSASGHGDGHGGGHAGGGKLGETFKLDPFVVNVMDRDRDRYLKLKAELELESEAVGQELAQRIPEVRDAVIALLSSKTFDEIRGIEGKNFLREEMLVRINAMLEEGAVRRVFFTEFVVQ